MRPRKIAIVGTAPSGALAPFDDDSWEIWGISLRAAQVTRATRWFELHRLDGETKAWAEDWRKAVKGFADCPLYMFYPEPGLAKEVIEYPIPRISKRFGTFFFTSSFAWVIALAIDELVPEGATAEGEIGLWGVDMEYGTEHREQRAGLRHFIDIAHLLGLKVRRLASSGLAYEPVPYPLWQDDPLMTKLALRQQRTKQNLENFNTTLRLTREQIAANAGKSEILATFIKQVPDAETQLAKLENQRKDLLGTSETISRDILQWEAINEEQCWLKDYLTS